MNIISKSDINKTLDENLTSLSVKMQEICNSDEFISKGINYKMDELCREIFYYLSDISDAVKLLNS